VGTASTPPGADEEPGAAVDDAVEIRSATVADADAIATLQVLSFRATYGDLLPAADLDVGHRARTWRARIAAHDGDLLVLTVRGTMAGFVWLGPTTDADDAAERVGQVRSVHVDPAAVGRGHGRTLLRAARDRFLTTGRTEATLWVVATNERAQAVYRRDGWHRDGATRREPLGLPGEAAPDVEVVRMRRHLRIEVDGSSHDA
jgi:ribosomal protein S18 acetylase RimI-like enzyme